jgi:hypothetical protein
MPIQVNNVEITDEDVFQEMQYQTDASSVEEVIFKAAQALVIQQLLLQEANVKTNDNNKEEKINQLINDNVVIPTASVEACQRYYENNKVKFLDKERDETLSFAMVEEHIKEYLQNQSTTSGIKEYINVLATDASIKGFDFKDPSAMNIKIQ